MPNEVFPPSLKALSKKLTSPNEIFSSALELVLGNVRNALPKHADAKPTFVDCCHSHPLPRCSPEAAGLSSRAVENFFREAVNLPGANVHSLMVLRGGRVVAEGSCAPFRQDIWHVSHSLCKTFTGTAVGFAVSEGLLSLDDAAVSFFSGQLNPLQRQYFKGVTVRHLLTMSSGISFNEISEAFERDWIKGFFSSILSFKPGTKFAYNSMNSYLLAAIVHKVSGQSLMDYLRPRLFDPLGFGPIAWEKASGGTEKGGWGMYLTPEDMAKLGLLYLQKGCWQVDGQYRQILPENWAAAATTTQISDGGSPNEYGYQMWTDSAAGTFTMNGIFGQYVFGVPSRDILVVMTSGASNLFSDSPAYNLMRTYFAGGTPPSDKKLFPAPLARRRLAHFLEGLTFQSPAQPAGRSTPLPGDISPFLGTTWQFEANSAGLLPLVFQGMNNNFSGGVQTLRLEKKDHDLLLLWQEGNAAFSIPLGTEKSLDSAITLGGETFLLGSRVWATDGGDTPSLTVELCFLELTSARYLTLARAGEGLQLTFDETPELISALELALRQKANTSVLDLGEYSAPLLGWLRQSEPLQAHMQGFVQPTVMGRPV